MEKLREIDPKTVITPEWVDLLIENDAPLFEELLRAAGMYLPSQLLDKYDGWTVGSFLSALGE